MPLPDAQLVAMTRAGDDRAFDQLVSRHRSTVYSLARRRTGCREAALDLAQEAFVQAYVCIGRLRDGQAFGPWVRGIAANLCRMHLRDRREWPTDDDALLRILAQSVHPVAGIAEVHDALADLPPGTRAAAILRFVDDLPLRDVAQELGISLAAAKSRVREARLHLRKEMTDMAKRTTKPDGPGKDFNRDLSERLALARWYREFSDLISSGAGLVSCLHQLAEGPFPDAIRQATIQLADAVEGGQTLSGALADLPALRAPQAIGMVRMGEVGGILDWTARFLADWLDVDNSRRDLEIAFWCGSLGSIIQAGVPVQMAVETSLGVAPDDAVRDAVRVMAAALEDGRPASAVLEQSSAAIPPIVVACARAGEAAGCLAWALRLAASELNLRVASRLASGGFLCPAPTTSIARPSTGASLGDTGPLGRPPDEVRGAFADALRSILRDHSDAPLRAAAAYVLGRIGDADGVPACEEAVGDADSSVRIAAIGAMAALAPDRAGPCALPLLDDPDSAVRQAAIEALAATGDRSAAERIASRMGDPDQRVADAALRLLEEWEMGKLVTTTAALLVSHGDAGMRVRAVSILEHRPDPDAGVALVSLLADDHQHLRWMAACALARIGRKEAIPVLVDTVGCPWSGIVRRAAEALALVGDASHAPCVRQALAEGRLHESYAWMAEQLEARKSPDG